MPWPWFIMPWPWFCALLIRLDAWFCAPPSMPGPLLSMLPGDPGAPGGAGGDVVLPPNLFAALLTRLLGEFWPWFCAPPSMPPGLFMGPGGAGGERESPCWPGGGGILLSRPLMRFLTMPPWLGPDWFIGGGGDPPGKPGFCVGGTGGVFCCCCCCCCCGFQRSATPPGFWVGGGTGGPEFCGWFHGAF